MPAEDRIFFAYHLAGSCRSGGDSRGTVYHAVQGDASYGLGPALCGKKPQGRSAGWSGSPEPIETLTCKKCRAKLQKIDITTGNPAGGKP